MTEVSFFEELRAVVESGERAVVFTVVAGEDAPVGAKLLVRADGTTAGDAPATLAALARDALRTGSPHALEHEGATLFADVYGPPPQLLVYGAVDTAEALCRTAKLLGWRTVVADARASFLTPERLPSADELVAEWPEEALARVRPDVGTAIVVLTHDDRFDVPLLRAALATDAFYIGALGSRRNQERRRSLLLEAGVAEHDLERIHGPAGLDVGAESPGETALSMLAEILAVRAGRPGGSLRDRGPHVHGDARALSDKK